MKDEAREKQEFEVFLSHNSQDKPAVRAAASRIEQTQNPAAKVARRGGQ
jgi:hypothetical protein